MTREYFYKRCHRLISFLENGKLRKVWPCVFYVIAVGLVALLLYLVLFFNPGKQIYRSLKIDKNTEKVAEVSPETLETVDLKFSKEVIFKNGVANYVLKNPANSSNSLVLNLRIKVNDNVIEKLKSIDENLLDNLKFDEKNKTLSISYTDCIPPGYNLLKIDMIKLPHSSDFPAGTYDGIMKVQTYTYLTNDKSFGYSEIPMKVTVK